MSAKPLLDAWRDYLSLRPEDEVRDWFDGFDWKMPERDLAPVHYPAERHLEGIAEHAGRGEKRLVEAFVELAPQLHWMQVYEENDFGKDMVQNYAHVEIIGTRGHFACNQMAGGIVLFGPGLQYPNHWHVAEEIYFPLTDGTLWSRDEEPFEVRNSGELIHHESNMHHAMQMQDKPLLALWIWRNGDLAQKSDF